MEYLIDKSHKKAQFIKATQKRYLFDIIDWSQRLIVILGYRGTGKTTLLLQYLLIVDKKGIYLSLDDFYFESNRLMSTITLLYDEGFRLFLLDEVHKYQYWSKDLKQIYDDYPDIQIVVTGSSILDISKGNADLSRRAAVYELRGLSFREFINFRKNIRLSSVGLDDVLARHHTIAPDFLDTFSFENEFKDYLSFGYFPYFIESQTTYHQKLFETIQLVIDGDVAPFEDLQHTTIRKLKKLLFVLSETVPFTPNINKLAEKLETTRNTVLKLLDVLHQSQIIQLLRVNTTGISFLQKPEKIYLQNTNFIQLFAKNQANIGNVRETFFLNQTSAVHKVTAPKYGDFMIDDTFVFEVGGGSKSNEQIRGIPNAFLALDIKGGSNHRIPLWLFGFLY